MHGRKLILVVLLGGVLLAAGLFVVLHFRSDDFPPEADRTNPGPSASLPVVQPPPEPQPAVFTELRVAGDDGEVALLPPSDRPITPADEPETLPRPPTSVPNTSAATDTQPTSRPAPSTVPAPQQLDLLGRADRALAAGDVDHAVALFQRATQHIPDDKEAWRGLAMALLAGKRYTDAIGVYDRLIELGSPEPVTLHNRALALARAGRVYEAERQYVALLRDHPNHEDARVNLATLYQARGKLADAAAQWRERLRRRPDHADAHASLAEVLTDLDRHDQAMHHYAEAAKQRPKRASLWLNLAASACRAGSGGKAITALDRAIELAPYDAEAWSMRGDVLLELYRATEDTAPLRQAVTAWQKSLALDADQPDLRNKLDTYRPIAENRPAGNAP